MAENKKVEKTKFGVRTTHPSYGTLLFSRSTGAKEALFGSSIQHRDTICMTLHHASIERGLNRDWIHGDKVIAEVEMSYSQFAEAITSMNIGTGVPVTVRWTEKDGKISPCDFVSKREQFEDEFKTQRKNATRVSAELIQEVTELFNQKGTLKKADKEEILRKLNKLKMDIGINTDFIVNQFNEQMDKTVMEAKGEIEAFYQNKVNTIASAALVEHRDELKRLDNPVEISEDNNVK